MRKIIIVFCMAAAVQIFDCTKSAPVAGGGVENGNGYVSGFVYTADGKPSIGALVRMTPADYVPSLGLSKKSTVSPCTTDAQGHYAVFTRVDSGIYNIEAVNDTQGALLDSVKVTGSEGQTVEDAFLHALGGIAGISFMPGQSDTSQVRVSIYMPGTRRITKPAVGGRFSFDAVPAGRYQMIFDPTLNVYHVKILNVTVLPGNLLDLDTVFLYGDSITGLPKVSAGTDTAVSINDTIRLHGRAVDPYGKIVGMEWDIGATGHFAATVSGDTAIVAGAVQDTSFACVLRAKDNDSNTMCDTVRIQILKDPPAANAGTDTVVSIFDMVNLHGRASDRFGRITALEWDIGAMGHFVKTTSGDTTFRAGSQEDTAFRCVLRATDDDGNTGMDTVKITILKDAPVVSLGPDTVIISRDSSFVITALVKQQFGLVASYKWRWETDSSGGAFGIDYQWGLVGEVISNDLTPTQNWVRIICKATDDDDNIGLDTMIVILLRPLPEIKGPSMVLAKTDGPYFVDRGFHVPAGMILTIEPGTVIRFATAVACTVEGTLNAVGTPTERIEFSQQSGDSTQRWGGIVFPGPASCTMAYCDIKNSFGIRSDNTLSSFAFSNCRFTNTSGDILFRASSVTFEDCLIQGLGPACDSYGIFLYGGRFASIKRNRIIANGTGGICASMDSCEITDNYIGGNNGTGISAEKKCLIVNNTIENNRMSGITLSDSGSYVIRNNLISNNAIIWVLGGAGIYCSAANATTVVEKNVIVDNIVGVVTNGTIRLSNNNIYDNAYLDLTSCADVAVPGNWWGTADTTQVRAKASSAICGDGTAVINISPVLTAPVPDAGPQ